MSVAVIIPVYKKSLSYYENLSLEQCFKVLGKYNIYFIKPNSLSLNGYNLNSKTFLTKSFEDKYFKNIDGYNKLMLNVDFYSTFISYDYILIYQLDAFVFKDELEKWCSYGYDYIAAPWFIDDNRHQNKSIHSKIIPWRAGNGGFSLRKIYAFLKVLNTSPNLFHILKNYYHYKNVFSYNNSYLLVKDFLKNSLIKEKDIIKRYKYFEDRFWSIDSKFFRDISVVPEDLSLSFAFEKHPEICFELNGSNLPFGCHGWYKYNREFWKEHIQF